VVDSGRRYKDRKKTYTSQENANYFPIFVSRGRFTVTDLGRQGEPLSNCGLNGGRSRGDEVSELIGCSNHEGPERWWRELHKMNPKYV
jgi:hypothetical protein